MASTSTRSVGIFDIPDEIFDKILSFISYEECCNVRLVSRKFNHACQQNLNKGFSRADKFHNQCQRQVRCQLPRRESERRNHPLARHVDILAAIETRLSLLHMTFMKYIDMGLCSFIPGKVLDEIFRVLRLVQLDQKPPRAHELLQELRDISSMAMEHFDEKIVPVLKAKMPPMQLAIGTSLPIASTSGSLRLDSGGPLVQNRLPALRQDVMQIRHNLRSTHMSMVSLKKEGAETKAFLDELKRKVVEQEKRQAEQERRLVVQSRKLISQDKVIADLNTKLLEYEQKFGDVFTKLAKVRPASTDPVSPRAAATDHTPSNSSETACHSVNSQQCAKDPAPESCECESRGLLADRGEGSGVKRSSRRNASKGGPSKRLRTK